MTKLYRSPVQVVLDARQQPRRFRCETYQGMVCDLFFAKNEGTWVLERVWD